MQRRDPPRRTTAERIFQHVSLPLTLKAIPFHFKPRCRRHFRPPGLELSRAFPELTQSKAMPLEGTIHRRLCLDWYRKGTTAENGWSDIPKEAPKIETANALEQTMGASTKWPISSDLVSVYPLMPSHINLGSCSSCCKLYITLFTHSINRPLPL